MPSASFNRSLLRWYDRNRRDLPWRATPANPYHVLVSEFMLQQTQVATVVPYFLRFMAKFPTIADLAKSTEQDVLRLWQGLGYYSRARNLRAAAKTIRAEHNGKIPGDAASLLNLPGIGRYTAGAIASIAFGKPEPILDGNVARVLCRLHGIESDVRDPKTVRELWRLAGQLVPARQPGDFNSAMMELGATVCTPRNPSCDGCPLRQNCRARKTGRQHLIPRRKQKSPVPLEQRWTYAICRGNRWLIEQRPAAGRWARLWQFPTLMPDNVPEFRISNVKPLGRIEHLLSHRKYVFTAFSCDAASNIQIRPGQKWIRLTHLGRYPMSKPQLRIARRICSLG
jgi:A/G-specific adenine glycosylase